MPACHSKEMNVFKQRPVRKSSEQIEEGSPDDNALIAESREHGIETRKGSIRAKQPVGMIESQSKSADLCIGALEIIFEYHECVLRQNCIRVEKYQDVSTCDIRTGVALNSSSAFRMDNPRAGLLGKFCGLIHAATVSHYDFSVWKQPPGGMDHLWNPFRFVVCQYDDRIFIQHIKCISCLCRCPEKFFQLLQFARVINPLLI